MLEENEMPYEIIRNTKEEFVYRKFIEMRDEYVKELPISIIDNADFKAGFIAGLRVGMSMLSDK